MADLRDYTKSNPIFVGTDGIRLPSGNSAQRVASANVAGTLRYNTDIGGMEVYSPNGWLPLAAPPSISTVSPSTFSGESGTEFTINGSNFTPDAQVYFVTSNGTSILATTVSYYSPVQVRATTPRAIRVQEEPVSVRVVQQSGTVTKVDCIDAGGVPNWITTAGTLGSIFGANTVNVYVSATDPEGTAISYQLSSGSLPGGLNFSTANGLIQGVASSVLANTTYNFTIKANDTVNNNTDRSFSYTVLNRRPVINTAAGSLGSIYSGNAASASISAYDPDGGQLTYSVSSGTLPVNSSLGSANGTITGTPVVVTTNTTYTFDITTTDEGSLTASNTYTYTVLNRPPVWNTAPTLPSTSVDYSNSITVNAYDPDGGSVTYAVTSGSLPSGLSLVSANGTIVGSPSEVTDNVTSTFNVVATDIGEMGNTRTFSLTITPITDPQFANTVLLLKAAGNTVIADASVNNLPLTVVGDSSASNFNPFGNSWSNFFDSSTTTGFSFPQHADYSLGTGDFTVEAFIYISETNSNGNYPIAIYGWGPQGGSPASYASWHINIDSLTTLRWYRFDGGTETVYSFGSTFAQRTWYHVAISRSGTSIRGFVNGQQVGTTQTSSISYNLVNGSSGGTDLLYVGKVGGGGAETFPGHISNLRVVKGTALYTANTSPITSQLTAITGTVLLTCQNNRFKDNSINNATPTLIGSPRVTAFSPFEETDTSNGSMYFDGTGDYVTIPNNTAFSYDGTFSAELWYYSTHTSCTDVIPFSGNGNWDFIIPAATTVAFRWFVPGYGDTGAHTMAPNSWNHIAVTVSGGRLSFYLNGVRMYTNASVSFSVGGSDTSKIGYGSNSIMKGYISNVRVTRGSTPYDPTQTTITVPSSPLTTISGTTFLTLQNRLPHNNHGFQDNSRNRNLITRFGNATQGTFTPFSADPEKWSNYFTSAGISIPYAASLQLQNTDWTIESYFNLSSASAEFCVMGASNGGGGVPKYFMGGNWNTSFGYTANRATFFTYTGSSRFIDVPYTWQIGRWYHMAAVYTHSNTTITLYVDGVNVGSMPYGIDNVTGSILIGRNGENGGPINGYISNFRYIVGTSLYTSNFTPSTIPLTAITNTQILTCQSNRFLDNSASNRTVSIAAGNPFVQPFSPFAPNSAYTTANTGGSLYLDGTGDYLLTQSIQNLAFRSGQFTMEAWHYGTTSSGGGQLVSSRAGSVNDAATISFYITGGNYSFYGNGNHVSAAYVTGQWNHVVYTRDASSTLRLFINGKLANYEDSFTPDITATTIAIGALTNGGEVIPSCWASDIRLVSGHIPTTYQTSSKTNGTQIFTPPTAPLTTSSQGALPNTVTMLMNFTNAAIIDYTGKNVIETIADTKSNNSIYKFSPGSMTFDGTGDLLTLRENEFFRFGSSDFTIEAWVYPTYVAGSNYYTLAWHNNGGSVSDVIGTTQFNINTWTHIAWSKTGTSMRFFINGVLDADGVKTVPAIIYNNADPLRIGYGVDHSNGSGRDFCHCGEAGGGNNKWFAYFKNGGTGNYYGHISDFRISRSARYLANFTPSTRSFPNK